MDTGAIAIAVPLTCALFWVLAGIDNWLKKRERRGIPDRRRGRQMATYWPNNVGDRSAWWRLGGRS